MVDESINTTKAGTGSELAELKVDLLAPEEFDVVEVRENGLVSCELLHG